MNSGARPTRTLRPIDPTDPAVAARIVEIQRAAYRIEADLIGFDGIPQLVETTDHVRALDDMQWVGAFDGDRLVGVVAWEQHGHDVDIDRLAVDPQHARQGLGRRLVQSVPATGTTTVSTGAANRPAVALYTREGFELLDTVEVAPGVRIARFRRIN